MGRYIFEVVGPGHHERSEFASRVVAAIATVGFKVAVEADLRPRLADDLSKMLQVGAAEVLLHAKGMVAKVVLGPEVVIRDDLEPFHDESIEVVIRLIPGDGPVRIRLDERSISEQGRVIEETLVNANMLIEKNS